MIVYTSAMKQYLSFRRFLEQDKPAPTDPKDSPKGNYLDGLKSELGVDSSVFKGQVIPVSNFKLGQYTYNHAELVVDDVIKGIDGEPRSFAVRILNHPGQNTRKVLVQKDGKYFNAPQGSHDSGVHMIPADVFIKYITQGFDQMGAGGAPPGGMPGGAAPGGIM